MEVMYAVKGSKGGGEVYAEMRKANKEWEWSYIVVATQYTQVWVCDNRSAGEVGFNAAPT